MRPSGGHCLGLPRHHRHNEGIKKGLYWKEVSLFLTLLALVSHCSSQFILQGYYKCSLKLSVSKIWIISLGCDGL